MSSLRGESGRSSGGRETGEKQKNKEKGEGTPEPKHLTEFFRVPVGAVSPIPPSQVGKMSGAWHLKEGKEPANGGRGVGTNQMKKRKK